MINPTRNLLSFPVRHATAIMLFGAAMNLALIVTAIAIPQFALLAAAGINCTLFLIGAYFAHKYTILQLNITANQAYTYGPLNSVTLDSYSVTSERVPTPAPPLLTASMVAPALQQIAQGNPSNNVESPALNVRP